MNKVGWKTKKVEDDGNPEEENEKVNATQD
jgi:hypothetical protein